MPKDYNQMLLEAEQREKGVRKIFDQYDYDGSGTIDVQELTSVMEELGLIKNLKTNCTEFVANMFAKYDENDDGVLSFEEFKKFYNAAKDDAAGRKQTGAIKGKDSKALDGSVEARRQQLKEEKARKKAEEAEKIRAQNAAMKAKLAAQGGRDAKGLDEEVLKARKEEAERRKKEKDAEAARLKQENREKSSKIMHTGSRTDHDLLDDVVDGVSVADTRKKKAHDSEESRQREMARAAQSGRDLKAMSHNTASRTDHDLLDDVVDGVSVADARKKKAHDSEESRQREMARAAQSGRDLKAMSHNTTSRTDHDLLDDVVDGVSVADARKKKAHDSEEARQQEMARAAQSGRDLKAMKNNTESRTDDHLS